MSSKASIDWERIYSRLENANSLTAISMNVLYRDKFSPRKNTKSQVLAKLYRAAANLQRAIEELEKPE